MNSPIEPNKKLRKGLARFYQVTFIDQEINSYEEHAEGLFWKTGPASF